jgi:transketolase
MLESEKYEKIAKNIRKSLLEMIHRTKSSHIGGCLSSVEILVSLYYKYLLNDPKNPKAKDRDIFILGKGHACPVLYAVLAERGFFKKSLLKKFAVDNGVLEQHPNRNLDWGIELSTGSLGHGLSVGAGMALARKKDNSKSRVFVLMGDGETEEGSVWEAALFSRHHKLDNLVAIVDYNKVQALDRVENVIGLEPFAEKWKSFGWSVKDVNGHDFNQLSGAFEGIPFQSGRPSVIIANTKKGKGFSLTENDEVGSHYTSFDEKEYKEALKELE